MNRRTLFLIAMAAVMIAAFLAFLAMYQGPPAGAATQAPPRHWLISKPELARIRAAGATAGFGWVMCDPVPQRSLGCPVPTFTSYYAFRQWVLAGGAGTAEIDYEGSVTPHWQMTHLLFYVRLTAQLGRAHGVFTILSPITSRASVPTSMLAVDEQAARYGAGAVDIQLQWMEQHPWRYAALLASWVPQIRQAGPGTLVLAGLATDPEGTPVTPWILTRTYSLTRDMVDGYWLNVHPWPGHPGCAPQGCPQVAVTFLRNIGA